MYRYVKGKSPVVPFHGITLPYSYFEEIWIFAQMQQEAKHDQEKISAEQKWKAQQSFAFLHIKPKFKFAAQWSWFLET